MAARSFALIRLLEKITLQRLKMSHQSEFRKVHEFATELSSSRHKAELAWTFLITAG